MKPYAELSQDLLDRLKSSFQAQRGVKSRKDLRVKAFIGVIGEVQSIAGFNNLKSSSSIENWNGSIDWLDRYYSGWCGNFQVIWDFKHKPSGRGAA